MIELLQLLITAVYIGYIWNKFGVLASISESTYKLEGPQRAWFLGWLGSVGLLNLFHPMEMYGFLTMVFLWFTGITINHKSKSAYTMQVHSVGAIGAILVSFIGLWTLHGLWIPSLLLAASVPIILKLDPQHKVWWIEIVAFVVILASYLFI